MTETLDEEILRIAKTRSGRELICVASELEGLREMLRKEERRVSEAWGQFHAQKALTEALERELAERTDERDHAREEGYAHVDLLMLRERERDAALRELAELREAARRLDAAISSGLYYAAPSVALRAARNSVRALLTAASAPTKEPA